ncbi:hypothetical protein [Cupriavidus sp. AcVe19-6a]|uniref:hypothetical protein n=1 Tax=Cupriavidus sp. AcVe19-6a TaxID=2821358 RepID=UPI001AE1F024|nr:hypothetical protein [Cupriavidus sp. AcVe19-6a]MBP0639117.1 hypothetical protein [Cupriavidus sp. AcVe19-6a]
MNDVVQALKDEVLLKMGRNLLLNQQVEHLLKAILGLARIEGTPADAADRLEARNAALATTSMGGLQRRFRNEVLASPEEPPHNPEPADASQPWFSTAIRFDLESSDREILEADLEALTADRNELAHHFLSRLHPSSAPVLTEASAHLDRQREKILAMHSRLKLMHGSMAETLQLAANFWSSGEGLAAIELMHLQSSRMMELLEEVAAAPKRADGWTDLAYASSIVQRQEPDALADRKVRYGEQSLKALVLKSGLFEVAEEVLPKGTRTLIRPRADV